VKEEATSLQNPSTSQVYIQHLTLSHHNFEVMTEKWTTFSQLGKD